MPHLTTESLVALLTLTLLEIVLGIDNIIFIAILVSKLPAALQNKTRRVGLFLAMFLRIGLLLGITWIMSLTHPLFTIPFLHEQSPQLAPEHLDLPNRIANNLTEEKPLAITGQRLILLLGGLFLIAKSTYEIHDKLEAEEENPAAPRKSTASFAAAILQIVALDLVFSLDSVITAVGMAKDLWVMIAAVIIAVGLMLIFSGYIVRFVSKHPTIKMLALSFLILIGVMLVAEGIGRHIEKGYVYFSMAFAVAVELLNIKVRKKSAPLHLHHSDTPS